MFSLFAKARARRDLLGAERIHDNASRKHLTHVAPDQVGSLQAMALWKKDTLGNAFDAVDRATPERPGRVRTPNPEADMRPLDEE